MQSLKERKRRAADRLRRWRHEKGISERYYTGVRIPQKYYTKRHRALMKKAGPLSIKTIQMVYEDNIKKYESVHGEIKDKGPGGLAMPMNFGGPTAQA